MILTSFRGFLILLFLIAISACAGINREKYAPPQASHTMMDPIGFKDVRYFGDQTSESLENEVKAFAKGLKEASKEHKGLNILALSGGGPNGAFGAGVLNGWTQTGKRPEFNVVTGISTGALIAPFAFLGSKYDDNVKRVYTTTSTDNIVRKRFLTGIISGGSLYSTAPLRRIIEREMTDAMIEELAVEYDRGRLLLIGTTNMDAERPVIWNLTEIASYRTPEAHDLVRDVIYASASIPVLFTPVRFNVTDGTEEFTELHADGGLTQEIFTYSPEIKVRSYLRRYGLHHHNNRVWVIHNGLVNPVYQPQKTGLRDIGVRTLDTLIKSQSKGDLERIASLAHRDGFSLRAMIMPAKFTDKAQSLFDKEYMNKLYNVGLTMGADQSNWGSRLARLFEKDKREGEEAIAAEEDLRLKAEEELRLKAEAKKIVE